MLFLGWEEADFNDQHLAAAGETFHDKPGTLWLLNAFLLKKPSISLSAFPVGGHRMLMWALEQEACYTMMGFLGFHVWLRFARDSKTPGS